MDMPISTATAIATTFRVTMIMYAFTSETVVIKSFSSTATTVFTPEATTVTVPVPTTMAAAAIAAAKTPIHGWVLNVVSVIFYGFLDVVGWIAYHVVGLLGWRIACCPGYTFTMVYLLSVQLLIMVHREYRLRSQLERWRAANEVLRCRVEEKWELFLDQID